METERHKASSMVLPTFWGMTVHTFSWNSWNCSSARVCLVLHHLWYDGSLRVFTLSARWFLTRKNNTNCRACVGSPASQPAGQVNGSVHGTATTECEESLRFPNCRLQSRCQVSNLRSVPLLSPPGPGPTTYRIWSCMIWSKYIKCYFKLQEKCIREMIRLSLVT